MSLSMSESLKVLVDEVSSFVEIERMKNIILGTQQVKQVFARKQSSYIAHGHLVAPAIFFSHRHDNQIAVFFVLR